MYTEIKQNECQTDKPTNIQFIATSKFPANKGMGRALGVETLGVFLKKEFNEQVLLGFTDLQYSSDPLNTVNELITKPNLDLIGISVRYGTYDQMEQVLTLLEKYYRSREDESHPLIVVGGVMPSFLAREIVEKHHGIRVVSGEGELAIRELVRGIRNNGSLYEVPSLTFFDSEKNEIISTQPRNLPLAETSSGKIIPDLIPQLREKGGIVWVSSSRGCPWDCSFCSVSAFREITGAKGKTRREVRPINDVIYELSELYNLGIRHFVFADDEMLTGSNEDYERWVQLAAGINNIGKDITFQCSVRSDVIWNHKDTDGGNKRRTAFHKLVEAGLTHVYMGLESGSPSQLKRYNKSEDVDTHLNTIRILREEGVLVGAGFIMFDPFMTLEEIQENIDFIKEAELVTHSRKDYIGDVFDLLRVQRDARFKDMLSAAGLLRDPIPGTLFYNYEFKDLKVRRIAVTCISLAAEIDDFFESLKNSVFAKELADEKTGSISPETTLLNHYLIELRLLDLSMLEELVSSSKETGQDYDTAFNSTILNFKSNRKNIIEQLYEDLNTGRIIDKDIIYVLGSIIDSMKDM